MLISNIAIQFVDIYDFKLYYQIIDIKRYNISRNIIYDDISLIKYKNQLLP